MSKHFDIDKAVQELLSGKKMTGEHGVLAPLIKQLTEAALQAELEQHLSQYDSPNRKNGSTPKTLKTSAGSIQLNTPRDRAGTFEPQLVKKGQTQLSDEIDQKILSMFALGLSYQDIRQYVREIYGIDVSQGTVNAVTDKLIPELQEWQQRPLNSHYPIVWLDAIHYKVRENGRYISKAVYTILALNLGGKKELLGIYLSDTEGANYWLSVLADLQNRGVEDILIACVDGLAGFPEAIEAIYPKTEVQLCVIHQIRNSLKYIAHKEQKAFMKDLRPVYKAVNRVAAEAALDELESIWGDKYPKVIESWRKKWVQLSAYFRYPEYIRRVIYTTNAVEAVHRHFRKLTKTKGGFPNESSLLKLLYAGMVNISKKWSKMSVLNWNLTLSQLAIYFDGRLDEVLKL